MNRTGVFALLSAATMFSLASPVVAEQRLHANVPFAFHVANQVLPAGKYLIHEDGAFLSIESRKNFRSVTLISRPGERSADGNNYLSFDQVNGVRFLRGVETPGTQTSVQVPRSKAWKQAREADVQSIALNRPQYKTTQP